jgi:hypothetical protein
MILVHAGSGETFDVPPIVHDLLEPSVQDVLNLITNAYFAHRGEKCIRLLVDGCSAVEDWAAVDPNATILAVAIKMAPLTSSPAADDSSAGRPSTSPRSLRHPHVPARGTESYSLHASRLREYIESAVGDEHAKRSAGVEVERCAMARAKVEEAMPPSALSIAAALARSQGKVLIQSMQELLGDQEAHAACSSRNDQFSSQAESGGSGCPALDAEEEKDHMTMLLLSHIPNELIAQMMEFGFSFQASARALLQCRLVLESAVSHVFTSSIDALEQPFSLQELRTFSSWYLSPTVADRGAPQNVSTPHSTRDSRRPPEFLQLLEMGFAPSQVRRTLRGADGNISEACSALLGDPSALQRVESRNAELSWLDPIEDAVNAGTLSALGVIECVKKSAANPQAVLGLWYDRNKDFRLLCEIFSSRTITLPPAS